MSIACTSIMHGAGMRPSPLSPSGRTAGRAGRPPPSPIANPNRALARQNGIGSGKQLKSGTLASTGRLPSFHRKADDRHASHRGPGLGRRPPTIRSGVHPKARGPSLTKAASSLGPRDVRHKALQLLANTEAAAARLGAAPSNHSSSGAAAATAARRQALQLLRRHQSERLLDGIAGVTTLRDMPHSDNTLDSTASGSSGSGEMLWHSRPSMTIGTTVFHHFSAAGGTQHEQHNADTPTEAQLHKMTSPLALKSMILGTTAQRRELEGWRTVCRRELDACRFASPVLEFELLIRMAKAHPTPAKLPARTGKQTVEADLELACATLKAAAEEAKQADHVLELTLLQSAEALVHAMRRDRVKRRELEITAGQMDMPESPSNLAVGVALEALGAVAGGSTLFRALLVAVQEVLCNAIYRSSSLPDCDKRRSCPPPRRCRGSPCGSP